MPRTRQVTNVIELSTLSICSPEKATEIITAFNAGKKVEIVESSFNDSGEDYVKVLIDGNEICHIKGY